MISTFLSFYVLIFFAGSYGLGAAESKNELSYRLHKLAADSKNCASIETQKTIERLLKDGADINYLADSRTPLIQAAASGCDSLIPFLLKKGAKLEMASDWQYWKGHTALFFAVDSGHLSTVRLLVKHGANLKARADDGQSLLHRAAAKGNVEMLEYLLFKRLDVNATAQNLETPLLGAVRSMKDGAVEFLLKKGAKVNAKNKRGWTALHWATAKNYKGMVALLQAAGAKDEPLPADFQAIANYSPYAGATTKKVESGPRICLAFDATGALTCRDMPGSSCPGNRFWAGPGPCSSYSNKTVQQLNKSEWGGLISAFNGEAEDRNKVDEPKQQSKEERCQKSCRQKKCGSKMSGEYTASASATLRCAGFCDQECSTNPERYR